SSDLSPGRTRSIRPFPSISLTILRGGHLAAALRRCCTTSRLSTAPLTPVATCENSLLKAYSVGEEKKWRRPKSPSETTAPYAWKAILKSSIPRGSPLGWRGRRRFHFAAAGTLRTSLSATDRTKLP